MELGNLFFEWVMKRGYIEPGTNGRKAILDDDALLHELAGMWRTHKHAIEALIKARIYPISQELLAEAHPFEVPILRQAMVEVAFIGDDLEQFARESERRKQIEKDGGGAPPVNISVSDAPTNIEDNGGTQAGDSKELSAV